MTRSRYDSVVMRCRDMLRGTSRAVLIVCVAVGTIGLIPFGCEEDGSHRLTESPPAAASPASSWRVDEIDGERTARLSVEHDEIRLQLAAAIEQARSTAANARDRWRETPESQRHRWAVKWAAPILDDEGAVEHVWIQPLHWSPFRIEGILLSRPDRPLDASGSSPARGDLVSFPASELSDWVKWHTDEPNDRRDGGFTIAVLERVGG